MNDSGLENKQELGVRFSELPDRAYFQFVQGGGHYIKRGGGWAPTTYNGPPIMIEGGEDPLVFPWSLT